MVSFRKMSMAFAGCLLTGIGIANAQTPITCSIAASAPTIRQEGLAEEVGKITLNCATPVNPVNTPSILISFTIKSNDGAVFTNNIKDKTARTLRDADIRLQGAGAPLNSFDGTPALGKLSSDGKTVSFNTVVVPAFQAPPADGPDADAIPDAQTAVIEISGLIINAHQATAVQPTMTVTAFSFQNGDGNKTITVTDGTVKVASVLSSVTFTSAAAADKLNCAEYAPSVDTLKDPANSALRKALGKAVFEPGYPSSLEGMTLTARFNVPTGAKLFVATSNIKSTGVWADPADVNPLVAANADDDPKTFVEVKANDDGIYEYSWVVASVGDGATDFLFPVYITIPQNFVSASGLTATGGLGPFSTTQTAVVKDAATAARYLTPTAVTDAIVSITSCSTTLLFPYVTNDGNWDTGIAIANPTADMKDDQGAWASGNEEDAKVGQNGTCTLYFVGANAPAKAIKSGTVKAGETVAFMVSSGSEKYAIAGVPGISGYLKVQCTFSGGKGFAFLSSPDLGGVGVGYTATDIDKLVP